MEEQNNIIRPHTPHQFKNPTRLQKIIKGAVLFFIFFAIAGAMLGSMQWFSESINGFFFQNAPAQSNKKMHNIFPDALGSVASAIDQEKLAEESLVKEVVKEEPWQIQASSALSLKISAGNGEILFEKEKEKRLPVASLVKLMTALVVLEHYDLTWNIQISSQAMLQEGQQGDLKQGQVFSVKDLLRITLMESSNKSAFALAESMGIDAFVRRMNERALTLGMADTNFKDVTGLNDESYSTTRDLAMLSRYLLEHYPLFKEIIKTKEVNLYLPDSTLHHKLTNTNQLLGQMDIVGGKTGFTKIAGECFMVVQENAGASEYSIHIILGSENRIENMKKLIESL